MNIKHITYLISGLFSFLLLTSCNNDESVTYTSQTNDAQIYSFSIAGQFYNYKDSTERALDSIRFVQVNKTRFAIDQVSHTIYNPDSLPYGTILRNKISVTATYNPTYSVASVKVIQPDSLSGFFWNGTDSIDFSAQPVHFVVTPVSGSSPRTYDIDIRIHKVDPDTIVWNQMTSLPSSVGKSKTLLVDNSTFYFYSVQNNSVSLFTSNSSEISWRSESISGLPATVKVGSIFNLNGVFYAITENGDSYNSSNGISWSKLNNGKILSSIIGILPSENQLADELLVVINDGGKYYFGKTKNLSTVALVEYISISPQNNQVPSNFPFQGGASFSNYSTDRNNRMLILNGGSGSSGDELNNTWYIKNSSSGLDMTTSSKTSLFKGTGLSNFRYDSKLYVLAENQFYISDTWGATWYKASKKQRLDPSMAKRSGQTVIIDSENNIWIFGGVSVAGIYQNDVWKGRLNKLK